MNQREIKFRAWDKKRKCWLTLFELPNCYHSENLTLICQFPERFEIVEFTGLKDKNGKEIYEGDVLELNWTEIQGNKYTEIRIVSGLEEGSFWMKNKEGERIYLDLILTDYKCQAEIIGNIYENPELLK